MLHRRNVNQHLLLALAIGFAYHGSLLFYTFRRTYDAYVHIFFGDHYARAWFDHWEYRWYTGFPMTSYPPGSHQTIALLSKVVGLENGFIFAQTFAILMVILGIYRFSGLWVSDEAAGYAALLAAFSSSLTETLHVFGQLPTTFSLGFLLNALPFVYRWIMEGKMRLLFAAWAINAATTAGHHVTTLFGAVFFVAPVMVLALTEQLITPLGDEPSPQPGMVNRSNWRPLLARYLRRTWPGLMRCLIYGIGLILLLILVVFPYWVWSASDPISQVPIPHASRDSFLENLPAGLVFWVVPYGTLLVAIPYVVYKGLTTKAWPLTLSFLLLFVLGTGGTTPIPRLLLRGAFDILTLDRFTFWATIVMLPMTGEGIASLRTGRLGRYIKSQFNWVTWVGLQALIVIVMIGFSIFVINLTQFRKFQPAPIAMDPIVEFLNKDEHWRWRFITLGFGDQMAWLSAQTTANSAEGNYHSARRLPELTTTPVERLDGAKFRGIPGIGSLQQFLTVPEKYNLKYVFSNDQFYDPLLYFSGWHSLGPLENGIVVWEREDIPPLPEVLPRKEIPLYQRAMWGIVPPTALVLGVVTLLGFALVKRWPAWHFGRFGSQWLFGVTPARVDGWLAAHSEIPDAEEGPAGRWKEWLEQVRNGKYPIPTLPNWFVIRWLPVGLFLALLGFGGVRLFSAETLTIEDTLIHYYNDLDFRRIEEAYARLDPTSRPNFEQYNVERSVSGGLLASYAKLDAIQVEVIEAVDDYATADVHTSWITSLQPFETTQRHTLFLRGGRWTIAPPTTDISVPPDQFARQETVAWLAQGRRRVTSETTNFADVLDRPELEILSARLVNHAGKTSIVGELVNIDADPADLTVTAYLYDAEGGLLSWYNAQEVMNHKILPKEVTPFRIDFEGVAGTNIAENLGFITEEDEHGDSAEFDPEAFTPLDIAADIANFEVYGKAVVTSRDLYRAVGVQNIQFDETGDGIMIRGDAINSGVKEAVLPHLLLTYYAEDGSVAWVDHHYLSESIRPQRSQTFEILLTPAAEVATLGTRGSTFTNLLSDNAALLDIGTQLERISLPDESGYASVRLTIHTYVRDDG